MSNLNNEQLTPILPSNTEAERLVLGCILLDNTVLSEVAVEIETRDFTLPSHQLVYEAFSELASRGVVINPLTTATELERLGNLGRVGGKAFVAALFDGVPRFHTVKSYTRQMREHTLLRDLIHVGQAIQADAFDGAELPEDQLARARQRLEGLDRRRCTDELRTGAMAGAQHIARLDELHQSARPFLGVATGIYSLDYALGGLQRGDLIIEGARPSMGKTASAARQIAGVAQSKWNENPVQVVFSLEMSPSEFVSRLQYGLSGVDSAKARNKALNKQDWRALVEAQEAIAKWHLFVFGQEEACDVRQQAALLRRVSNELGHVDVVYCDHLGFCRMRGVGNDNRNVLWDEITKEQKRLAKQHDAAFVVLSQLSRANEKRGDKRPTLSDLRESGGIEQNADVVLFVHREFYYDDRADPTLAEWIIAKQRNGPLATVELNFDRKTAWFENRAGGYA